MELRTYQQDCLQAIESAGAGRWLCQLATGLGKTVIFASIPRQGSTLVLSHRTELVHQPVRHFSCPVSIEMGQETSLAFGKPATEVVSASVQTMARRKESFAPDAFDTIIVDEAHHSASPTYQAILNYFKPRRLLGFTATPNRADGVGLSNTFDKIIFERSLEWGIRAGWLSPIHCRRLRIGYDLSQVAVRMGDYAQGELERAVNTDSCNKAIASCVKQLTEFPAIVFCVDVAHAEAVAKEINAVCGEGFAKALSAKSNDRAEALRDYQEGRLKVLVNCALFTEGTDLPMTRTVIIARPTKSETLYTQMAGRGTRLYEGKTHCNLIDCVGVSSRSICTAPTLIGWDCLAVPERYTDGLEGDLLDDIPQAIAGAADTPESWIRNVEIVDLWAKQNRWNTHDVNYIRRSDGSLIAEVPGVKIKIDAPDLLGVSRLHWNSRTYDAQKMQDVLDRAFLGLKRNCYDAKPLWCLSSAKRWGRKPATDGQKKFLSSLAMKHGVDLSRVMPSLTKLQATQMIGRLK